MLESARHRGAAAASGAHEPDLASEDARPVWRRYAPAITVLVAVGLLALVAASAAQAAFPGDNGKIAFTSDRAGNHEIFVMDADGSSPKRLTSSPGSDYGAVWSPDGQRIAFHSTRDGDWEIFIMDADGSNQTQLTTNSVVDAEPTWSPGGEKIAFTSQRDGDTAIFVMDATGANQRRLTSGPARDLEPVWSPDGQKIAFTSLRDGEICQDEDCVYNYEIYVMDANGANQTRLTNDPASDRQPAWSPDGQKIAITSDRDGDHDVYVMDADVANLTQLTNSGNLDGGPAWSPDGQKIAFNSFRDGNYEVYVMDATGANQTRLTVDDPPNFGADDDAPDWQPLPRDTTVPTLAPTINPTLVYVNQAGATASPHATDSGSGVASQSCGAVDTSTAGVHTVTCTATDNAGNTNIQTIDYTVHYRLLGFFAPVFASDRRAGQCMPVRIALADANRVRIADPEAAELAATGRVTFSATGAQALAAQPMKYDAVDNQFVFNWKLSKTETGFATIAATVSYIGTATTTTTSAPISITG